jgi:hypothetical protein
MSLTVALFEFVRVYPEVRDTPGGISQAMQKIATLVEGMLEAHQRPTSQDLDEMYADLQEG